MARVPFLQYLQPSGGRERAGTKVMVIFIYHLNSQIFSTTFIRTFLTFNVLELHILSFSWILHHIWLLPWPKLRWSFISFCMECNIRVYVVWSTPWLEHTRCYAQIIYAPHQQQTKKLMPHKKNIPWSSTTHRSTYPVYWLGWTIHLSSIPHLGGCVCVLIKPLDRIVPGLQYPSFFIRDKTWLRLRGSNPYFYPAFPSTFRAWYIFTAE